MVLRIPDIKDMRPGGSGEGLSMATDSDIELLAAPPPDTAAEAARRSRELRDDGLIQQWVLANPQLTQPLATADAVGALKQAFEPTLREMFAQQQQAVPVGMSPGLPPPAAPATPPAPEQEKLPPDMQANSGSARLPSDVPVAPAQSETRGIQVLKFRKALEGVKQGLSEEDAVARAENEVSNAGLLVQQERGVEFEPGSLMPSDIPPEGRETEAREQMQFIVDAFAKRHEIEIELVEDADPETFIILSMIDAMPHDRQIDRQALSWFIGEYQLKAELSNDPKAQMLADRLDKAMTTSVQFRRQKPHLLSDKELANEIALANATGDGITVANVYIRNPVLRGVLFTLAKGSARRIEKLHKEQIRRLEKKIETQ